MSIDTYEVPLRSQLSLVKSGKLKRVRQPRATSLSADRLKLLSFNIQAGIGTSKFSEYITGSWKHLVAAKDSRQNIEQIADVLRGYDLVALQEVDGGSHRSQFINQLLHLANEGDFPFWHQQLNRNLGNCGQFSNGLLSRMVPYSVEDYRLPGLPGRGAFVAKYGHPDMPLVVVGVHLALGEKRRTEQLAFLSKQLKKYRHVIIMGDFNCTAEEVGASPLATLNLKVLDSGHATYPSWSPEKHLDHIVLSDDLKVTQTEVLSDCQLSDHLPIETEIWVPDDVRAASLEAADKS